MFFVFYTQNIVKSYFKLNNRLSNFCIYNAILHLPLKENIEYVNLYLNNLLASFFYVDTFRSVKGIQSSDPVDLSIFYMQQNVNKCLKIEDIAAQVKLSESHLSELFRNKTGSSPFDYFINLKMQEAIRLLTNKSLRIKEVAFKLGYSDQYYFTRIFTKQIGKSPASFIKTSRR